MPQTFYPAFEIYAGDTDDVRAACAWRRLEELWTGKVTPHLALFPSPFWPGDVLLVERAVAAITGLFEPLEIKREELDCGIFFDSIALPWVESVARIGIARAAMLQAEWSRAYEAQEKAPPEWSEQDHVDLMARFISACTAAVDSNLATLLVWAL